MAKMTARCALYMGALKMFESPWVRPRLLLPKWAFVLIDPMNMRTKFEVRNFTYSWDNRGYSKYLGSPWICPRSFFSQICNGLFGWIPVKSRILLFDDSLHSADKDHQQRHAVAAKPHVRCRCKIQYVSKFVAALRGSPCNSTAFLFTSVAFCSVLCIYCLDTESPWKGIDLPVV